MNSVKLSAFEFGIKLVVFTNVKSIQITILNN
jgi:hypothetical protein